MNWFILISGVFALFTTVGHFTIGSKNFLSPMLKAELDDIPKKVMHSVFHYISVYLISSTIVLLAFGAGVKFNFDVAPIVIFIAINYVLFALAQIAIALNSKIENAAFKLFQWIFFVLIAVFAFLGTI